MHPLRAWDRERVLQACWRHCRWLALTRRLCGGTGINGGWSGGSAGCGETLECLILLVATSVRRQARVVGEVLPGEEIRQAGVAQHAHCTVFGTQPAG